MSEALEADTVTESPTTANYADAEFDVATRSVSWGRRPRRTALFRIKNHRAILQHVRETTVRQRGGPSTCWIDPAASIDDVPEYVLAELRAADLTLAGGGEP